MILGAGLSYRDAVAAVRHGLATAHIARPREHGPGGGEAGPSVPATFAVTGLVDRLGC